MKKLLISTVLLGLYFGANSQSNIAFWDFNSTVNDATVTTGVSTPAIGTGSYENIGGTTNTFATGYASDLNLTDNSGVNLTTWPAQSTLPKTAGAQFNVSTVGFNRINFEFWQRLSNTAANTWVVQYTLDNTGVSTGGIVTWTDAQTYTFTPQPTGTGDTWYFRSVDFSAVSGLNNNVNAAFRVVSNYDPISGTYLSARSTSVYGTTGTSRFDLARISESKASVSIAAANNFVQVAENIGTINVPITVTSANLAPINLTFAFSIYSNATENADFTWTNSLVIPANTNGVFNLPITITDDATAEKAERIVVKLVDGSNATASLTNNYQIIFIKDNDYVAPAPSNELNLSLLSSFSNGPAGPNSAEIVAFDPTVDRLYIANSLGQKLDIVNFSNPSSPVLVTSISLAAYGNINSVEVHNGIVAVAIESIPAQTNGKVVFFDANGVYINQVTVGAMPDMIKFTPDFTKIMTANEGEPNSDYSIDPEGSVSVIDLSPGYASLTNANVTNIGFTAFNGQEVLLRSQGIRVFSTSASVAQDFEPEYIAISDDNTTAYVTLQENNALVTINLTTNTITSITPLGLISYSGASGNALDASDQSGAVLITGDLPIKGVYMPDAIKYHNINSQGYIFTANEGDSREFGTVIDANRISSATFNTLDATVFPDQNILRNNKFLGRLSALKYSGDTDGDGDYDELHVMGGRSFSIWNSTTGALVFDSKDLIEQITSNHAVFGSIFNASNSIGVPTLKNRSDDKGPEAEGITVQEFNGSTYAFVALERIGGVMIFNVDNPAAPVYSGYYNNRSTTVSGPDLGSEGIITILAADSPNGNDLVILANEVSSTLSVYQMQTCAQASNAVVASLDNSICPGQSTLLSVTGAANTSYQWYLNNQIVGGANSQSLLATEAGNYKLFINNSTLGCNDTTNTFVVTLNLQPSVNAGSDQTLCAESQATLLASGADSFVWSNGNTNASISVNTGMISATTEYIVIGADVITGCTNSDTVSLYVNALPIIAAGVDMAQCSNEDVVLSATGATQLNWSGLVQNNVAFNLSAGVYNYTVTGIDGNGCENTDQIQVTIYANPTVIAGTDAEVCENETPISITASSPDVNLSFLWSNSQTGQTLIATQSNTYTVEVTDQNGCTATDDVIVLVNSNPIVNAGDIVESCSNDLPVTLTANVSGSNNAFDWSTSETNQAIDVSSGGTYSVTVTDLNGCEGYDEVILTINQSPSVNAGADQIVCESNFPANLNATGTGAVDILWSNGAQNAITTVNSPGTYSVTITAANGCEDADEVVITSDPCLGLIEVQNKLLIYPNPTTELVNIDFNNNYSGSLTLRMSDGKIVMAQKIENSIQLQLDVRELSQGMYILELNTNGIIEEYKIIKE